ncbi:MAG: hypothetical protein LBG43_06085 [Treponema sp.]|nr:hypothetical protein [Treponema sp.]
MPLTNDKRSRAPACRQRALPQAYGVVALTGFGIERSQNLVECADVPPGAGKRGFTTLSV